MYENELKLWHPEPVSDPKPYLRQQRGGATQTASERYNVERARLFIRVISRIQVEHMAGTTRKHKLSR